MLTLKHATCTCTNVAHMQLHYYMYVTGISKRVTTQEIKLHVAQGPLKLNSEQISALMIVCLSSPSQCFTSKGQDLYRDQAKTRGSPGYKTSIIPSCISIASLRSVSLKFH